MSDGQQKESTGIDPESFRGKLILLIIDKFVIGVLIVGGAFAAYNWFVKVETRLYDEARREVDLGFKRAEYVKELVPIAMNREENVFVRAQALAALVDTEAISTQSAISFARELLFSDILGAVGYGKIVKVYEELHKYKLYPAFEDDFFLATMIKVMPSGIPFVLNEFTHAVELKDSLDSSAEGSTEQYRILNSAVGFWIELFRETVVRFEDSELSLLNSEPFLAQNIDQISAIVPTLSVADAERWFRRENRALKTIGALRLLKESPQGAAIAYLKPLLNPKSEANSLAFAIQLIKLLRGRRVVSPELSTEALQVVLARENSSLHRKSLNDKPSPTEDHFHVTAEYLVWSGKFPQVVKKLEHSVVAELRGFYNKVTNTPAEILDRKNYPVEWTLVHFLMDSNSIIRQEPSENAQKLLSDLFSMEAGKLSKVGLDHYAAIWRKESR